MQFQDVIQKCNCLASELDTLYHQAAKKLKVSDTVLMVAYMIYEKKEGCLLCDICADSSISKQTINSALRKLENENILYLKQDKGKTKRIYLTEKGKKFIEETALCLMQAECRVFQDWTEEEIFQYLRLMKKYNDAFKLEVERMERKQDDENHNN